MMKWRQMLPTDLEAVNRVADEVHVNYPEDAAVFAERQALYAKGCHVLIGSQGVVGYTISHPWHFKKPPELNVLLGDIPEKPTTYYLHDIALLPTARGSGSAPEIVKDLLRFARDSRFPNVSLVAVNDSRGFWEKLGFEVVEDPELDAKLRSYDDKAKFMVCDFGV
jgi:GNAT superfamily N-acetyltransferase